MKEISTQREGNFLFLDAYIEVEDRGDPMTVFCSIYLESLYFSIIIKKRKLFANLYRQSDITFFVLDQNY